MNTPLLILAWRRPQCLRKLIDALRPVKPRNIYASIDGPRKGNDFEKDQVKKCICIITSSIDWDCSLDLNVSILNKGCRLGVTSGIDWFFSNVKEGIILEDDCLPHPDFFSYCESLLDYYRHNRQVAFISGDNSHGIIPDNTKYSYTFIRTPLVWGWATWANSWFEHDRTMTMWCNYAKLGHLPSIFYSREEHEIMCKIYDQLCQTGLPDTWDYQLAASFLLSDKLCVIPRENLISNIGFDHDATHTTYQNRRANSSVSSILPISHPPKVQLDRFADQQVFEKVHHS